MLQETSRKDPASVPRMATATMTASGRRYRGLSAEERRADQRERLVRRDQRVLATRLPPNVGRRHRAQRTPAAPRSTRSSTTAKPRCTARCKRRCAGSSRRCKRISAQPHPARASSKPASPRFVGYLVSDPAAARILLLEGIGTSPEVNALRARVRSQVASTVFEIWATYDPEAAASPQATRSRSACSACCSSRCCIWSRATASTRRRRTFPRS